MTEVERLYRIEVLADGDPLRSERLTRSLRDDLVQLDEVSVDFASGTSDTPGSKGGALTELALIVAGMASSKPLAGVLTTTISEWCNRGRRRKVRITRGDSALEITGNPDIAQQQLAREFMEKFEGDA